MPGTTVGKAMNFGYPGNVSRSSDAVISNHILRSTDTVNVNFGDAVALNTDNTLSAFNSTQTQLTAALTSGTAYTSLSVQALTAPVNVGDSITIGTGGTTQTVTASAAAAVGATTISVNSFNANAAYAVSTAVLAFRNYAEFAGIAVREVKQNTDYFNPQGYYTPGQPCDVVTRGSVTVKCNNGTPTAGGPVYVRIAANGAIPNGVVGQFEAVADGANTVLLTNLKWRTGKVDTRNVAEVTILTRNNA